MGVNKNCSEQLFFNHFAVLSLEDSLGTGEKETKHLIDDRDDHGDHLVLGFYLDNYLLHKLNEGVLRGDDQKNRMDQPNVGEKLIPQNKSL